MNQELRQLAGKYLAHERRGHTLQPTALVNKASLRLVDLNRIQWQDRAHFFAMAARAMRRILVDHAAPGTTTRGAEERPKVSLELAMAVSQELEQHLVELDDALRRLRDDSPAQGRRRPVEYASSLA